MEQVYIQHIANVVTAMQLSAEPLEGWVATGLTAIPNTEAQDGCTVEVLWDGKTLSVVQVPKPIPTEEELADARRQAYVAECDPLSMAYVGYMLEGDEAKAMSAKASYLERKADIRKRFKE
jgi:hypothetical protein